MPPKAGIGLCRTVAAHMTSTEWEASVILMTELNLAARADAVTSTSCRNPPLNARPTGLTNPQDGRIVPGMFSLGSFLIRAA